MASVVEEVQPGELLAKMVEATGGTLGAIVYAERYLDGKLSFNVVFANRDGASMGAVLDAFEGLSKAILTHYQRLKNSQGRILVPSNS